MSTFSLRTFVRSPSLANTLRIASSARSLGSMRNAISRNRYMRLLRTICDRSTEALSRVKTCQGRSAIQSWSSMSHCTVTPLGRVMLAIIRL